MTYDSDDAFDPLSRPILSIGLDDLPECPECGNPMGTVMVKVSGQWMPSTVSSDEDGPLFRGRCRRGHGEWLYRVLEEEFSDAEDYDHDHALDTWHGEGGPDYA